MPAVDSERARLLEAIAEEGRRSGTRSVMLHAVVADKLGLNHSDTKCADLIQGQEQPITAGRLAELTGLSTGAITGVLDRLERAGFIRREGDPQDRRRVVIRSTPECAPNLASVFTPLRDAIIGFSTRYSNDELRVILDFMQGSGLVLMEQMARLRELGPIPRGVPQRAEERRPSKVPSALREAAERVVQRSVSHIVSQVAADVTAEVTAHLRRAAKAKRVPAPATAVDTGPRRGRPRRRP